MSFVAQVCPVRLTVETNKSIKFISWFETWVMLVKTNFVVNINNKEQYMDNFQRNAFKVNGTKESGEIWWILDVANIIICMF